MRVAIEKQAHKLSNVVASLKETQTRLVNSEKLASLGEVTAGIAHELLFPYFSRHCPTWNKY